MQRLFFAAIVLGAISALRKKDPDPYYLKVKRVSFISPVNDTVMYYDNEVGAVVLFFIAFEIVEHLGEVHRDEGKFWGLDIRAGRHEHECGLDEDVLVESRVPSSRDHCLTIDVEEVALGCRGCTLMTTSTTTTTR